MPIPSSGYSVSQTRQRRLTAGTRMLLSVGSTSVRGWHLASVSRLPRLHRAGPSASLDVERELQPAPGLTLHTKAAPGYPSFGGQDAVREGVGEPCRRGAARRARAALH